MNKVFIATLIIVLVIAGCSFLLKSRENAAPIDSAKSESNASVQNTEPTYEEISGEREPYPEEQSPEDTLLGDED